MKKLACFVTSVDPSLAQKMENDLINQGFEISRPIHTFFQAQKKGISCTLYLSGKLTVQGKEKDEFISYYLEPEILKTFNYSYPEEIAPSSLDLSARIGVDEAGKGDFFGPLCIASLYADQKMIPSLLEMGVKDSKEMSDKQTLKLSLKIKQLCPHRIVRISPRKYNELYSRFHNLNRLLAWGHATAITELFAMTGCDKIIIDQFAGEHVVKEALEKKNISVHLSQRHRAEEDVVVAGASILARAAFLEGLSQLSTQVKYPLPKGASRKVIEMGKELVAKMGEAILDEVAKLHFKTTQEILGAKATPSE